MLHERRKKIIEQIREQKTLKIIDIQQTYDISVETARRDLDYLEKKGYLKRVYGGAILGELLGQEPTYQQREVINLEYKKAIASKAAEYINDGDTLFLDVGTTTLQVALALVGKKDLTVITNATFIAQTLAQMGMRTILLGGELRKGELSVSGALCTSMIELFHADKVILGVGGITQDGISDYHLEEVYCRKSMIRHSTKVIAVTDYSKFGLAVMNKICSLDEIDLLITDDSVSSRTLSEYRAKGLEIAVATV